MVIVEFIVGALSSIAKSGKDISNKFAVEFYNDTEIGVLIRYISLFFLIPFFFFVPFRFSLNYNTIGLVLLNSFIMLSGSILVSYSIRISDISIVTPIYSLSPIVTALHSIIIIKEIPTSLAFIGILIVSLGVYVLNIKSISDGLLDPIKSIVNDRGVQIASFTTIYISIIPVLNKIGIEQTSVYTWTVLINIGLIIISLPYLIYKFKSIYRKSSEKRKPIYFLILMGFSTSMLWIFGNIGYSLTNVAYIAAIKKTSIILNILAGYYIFNEKLALSRIPGGILIIIGLILISSGI